MKVFTGALFTETNTFAPMPTSVESFKSRCFFPAGHHPDYMTHGGGPLWAARIRARERGWEVVEGLVAAAQPSGKVTRQAYESLRDQLLNDLKDSMPVDMVVLGLHGAMVADGYDDCEGDTLKRIREIVGEKVTVGATLDLHSAFTNEMVQYSDVLIAYKEYPHTDVLERALELVDICAARVEGRRFPVASVVDCNMAIHGMHTTNEPMSSFVSHMKELEQKNETILSVSLIHGFVYGDVPGMGIKALVYTDDDKRFGDKVALELAQKMIDGRHDFGARPLSIEDALDEAVACPTGPVVLADIADNTGGGAAGDSTFVIRSILKRGLKNVLIGPVWDPVAVRIAFDAGEGSVLNLRIGGKVSPASGEPLDLPVKVHKLITSFQQGGVAAGTVSEMGDSAFVESDGVFFVLVSLRNQASNIDLFTKFGADISKARLIVVKSSQHFYGSFSKVAAKVVYASSPGALTSDLSELPYKNIKQPKWPFQDDAIKAELVEIDVRR
ncbi:M81 family metallopeptidase [Burkholderia sp. Ac-20349]|uniref:M81 family metallopeptidase n=1 Tax=Burkholderia sp. Ac-20349 TaxID=2703893 RepID=UPI00197BDED4|nr:M81 family metallopeptidase [Burkholderia sp. Ac-20349]